MVPARVGVAASPSRVRACNKRPAFAQELWVSSVQPAPAEALHIKSERALFQAMRDNVNMQTWPDRRLLELLKLEIPIIQAPMAGSDSVALARSVSSTGALGSLACALLSPDQLREAVRTLRQGMTKPINLNFFCHTMEAPDSASTENGRIS